ncbi:MAG: DUF2164 domain-containing protein [Lachnospiraceae bacterium]|nr:DUF2164 domain-containing protein [Lachnospiraceae bacterium]
MTMDTLSREEKNQMLEEIAYFFKEEFELDLGIIRREAIFDFFQDNLAKYIYNRALDDAKRFYEKSASNMESDYYALYKD